MQDLSNLFIDLTKSFIYQLLLFFSFFLKKAFLFLFFMFDLGIFTKCSININFLASPVVLFIHRSCLTELSFWWRSIDRYRHRSIKIVYGGPALLLPWLYGGSALDRLNVYTRASFHLLGCPYLQHHHVITFVVRIFLSPCTQSSRSWFY